MKLKNLLLSLVLLLSYQIQSQNCGTPALDAATRKYILKEIIPNEESLDLLQMKTNNDLCLPLKIHIVRKNNGSFGYDPANLVSDIAETNALMAKTGIRLYICGEINYINNSDFHQYNSLAPDNDTPMSFVADELVSNAINIFITGSLTSNQGVLGGFAFFPSDNLLSNSIFMSTTSGLNFAEVLAHEFGHYFSLVHTHEGTENGPDHPNAERVVRTGVNANCSTRGDMLCETDADPRYQFDYYNIFSCTYSSPFTDDLGASYSPTTAIQNLMSYYPKGFCGIEKEFTPGQITRMQAGLVTRMGHSTYDYSCTPDFVAPPTNLTATKLTFIGTVIDLEWTDNADNELGYIIERAPAETPSFFENQYKIISVAKNETEYTDFEIDPTKNYLYRIRPLNGGCDSYSEIVSSDPNAVTECEENINGYNYLGEWNNSKYFISKNKTRWKVARNKAISRGGHLVAINSLEENNQIKNWVDEIVYIGYNDNQNEGTFEWENGDPISIDNLVGSNTDARDFGQMKLNGKWRLAKGAVLARHIMELPCLSNCFCSEVSDPVCADGVTYLNACEAECAGEVNYIPGECSLGGVCAEDNIEGFTLIGEFGNSKYYLSNSSARPTDAQIICENNGGYLSTISSEGENNFIRQGIPFIAFIGLNDEDVEGEIEWFSGEPLTYNNEGCVGCDENSENNDYGFMLKEDGKWGWGNFFDQFPYVMEIPCVASSNISLVTIPEFEKEKLDFVAIVPNPANQFIDVQLKSNIEMDVDIQIFDSRGVMVQSRKSTLYDGLNAININISNLTAGMYWINIPQANRNHSVKKFVKILD